MRPIALCLVSLLWIATWTPLLADTPEKIDDPEALRQQVERLRTQDHWTQFATPEQMKLFEGPETVWPELPQEAYDLTGVNTAIIGSKVPPPGVHPRIFFSPEDLPALRQRILGSKRWVETEVQMLKTILDPQSDDGKVFAKLADGDLAGLEFPDDGSKGGNGQHVFKGYRIGIHAAHVCYWPRNLNAIAFYALMKDDAALGRRVALALVNYYKLREPLIDKQNARGQDPNAPDAWPSDMWRGMHWVAGEGHLGFAYDQTAMYMDDAQKAFMRRIIVKATAGKRQYGGNAPIRWRDVNWVGWDTQHVLCHLAIEGEEGYEPELLANLRDTVYGYLTYGISPYGTIFETNGKNSAGFQYAMNSLVAVARRGHSYLLGHPHLRKLAASQIHQVVPAGGRNNNNGTYGCNLFREGGYLKNLYPGPLTNWLLLQGQPHEPVVDLAAYRDKLNGQRNWYNIHPLEASTWLGMAEYEPEPGRHSWQRDQLNLPLDFEDPNHGQLCTRSGHDQDALYLMTECRPDLYTGGHQHFDAGHFYLSALGVNWGVEGNDGIRASRFHSVVMIDGIGQGANGHFAPSRGQWLDAQRNEHGAFARMGLKNCYDFIWINPMHYAWGLEDRKAFRWEPVTDPEVVKYFKGTQQYKVRLWASSYWDSNWSPQLQASWNPVQYAWRTAGIVRGTHPYALVVDDIQKDDAVRLYEWQMQIPDDVIATSWWKMPQDMIVLARSTDCQVDRFITPKKGSPCLAVLVLDRARSPYESDSSPIFPAEVRRQLVSHTSRLVITSQSVSPRFKIALVPFTFGSLMPSATFENGRAVITWSTQGKTPQVLQQDEVRFDSGPDHRTTFAITRGGTELLQVR